MFRDIKYSLSFFTIAVTILLSAKAWSQNALIVEDSVYFRGSTDNVLTISMTNEGNVSSIQFHITFDPDCFSIDPKSRMKTERTKAFALFHADCSEPGLVRFATVGLGVHIPPGSGPIVQFTMDVSVKCTMRQYTFDLSNSRLEAPNGYAYSHDVVNGTITVEFITLLSIEDRVVFQNSQDNVINLNLNDESQDIQVWAAEIIILFDKSCFDVTSVESTNRTRVLNIFNHADTDSGIKIVMFGFGNYIVKGVGPIAEIFVDVGDCPEGYYSWKITNSTLADGAARDIAHEAVDGTIAIWESPKGDINDDGTINTLDVVIAIRIALGQYPDPSERELQAADCNLDGQVDVADIIGIVNMISDLGICLP